MAPPAPPATAPAFGLNLIGFFGSDTGLGNTARAFAQALDAHRVPISRVDISAEASDAESPEAHAARLRASLVHPVNLHMADGGLERVLARRALLFRPDLMQVGMLWWETTVLPPALATIWRSMDAVLACSSFIAAVAANHLTLTPVLAAKHPLADMADVRPDRARFGMPGEALVFTASFHALSDPARKNPIALIQVFRAAFPEGAADARLFIRINHAHNSPLGRWSVQQLAQAAGEDPRIRLLTGPMDYPTVLSFYASGDVYLSLHRAEGLGLGMMEAMALGKPVIATGWSGNMDFMGYDCACPVRYTLGPPKGNNPVFSEAFLGPHALWAAPVFEDAVAWMRRLSDDPDLRTRIGQAARQRMARHRDEAATIAWAHELAALWRARAILPAAPGKYSRGDAPA